MPRTWALFMLFRWPLYVERSLRYETPQKNFQIFSKIFTSVFAPQLFKRTFPHDEFSTTYVRYRDTERGVSGFLPKSVPTEH